MFKIRHFYNSQFMKASERIKGKHFYIHSKVREKFMTSAPPFKSQGIKVLLLHTKSKLNWSLRLARKEHEL